LEADADCYYATDHEPFVGKWELISRANEDWRPF
jgi:hypothetical protein